MTDPLTPADCDLRGLEWMPLYGARLLTSETWLRATPEARCAALTLWWASWHQVPAASLADDDLLLSQLAGYGVAGVKQWRRVRDAAMRGWIKCSDGRLYHPIVAALACEAWERRGEADDARDRHRQKMQRWRDAKRNRHGGGHNDGSDGSGDGHVPSLTGTEQNKTEERKVPPSAAAVPAAVEPDDVRTQLFREGLATLRHISGKTDAQSRSLLGRWLRDARDDAARLLSLLRQAEDMRCADPIAWISASLRGRSDPFLATIRADINGTGPPEIAAETPIETMLRLERAKRH